MSRKKRKASPAQLAARAKFTAMVRSGRKFGRKVRRKAAKVGRKSAAAAKAFRKTNPARSAFQIAAAKGKNVLFLAGIGLSSNRATASNFGTLSTARKIARQVRDVGRKLGVGRVAVVTSHDSPQAIRSFLLGDPLSGER
ncbi:hypothetical protein EHM76_00375 [bacterium]|nr:MAG: hypothetical protein EHM76_00375 [bacterium]